MDCWRWILHAPKTPTHQNGCNLNILEALNFVGFPYKKSFCDHFQQFLPRNLEQGLCQAARRGPQLHHKVPHVIGIAILHFAHWLTVISHKNSCGFNINIEHLTSLNQLNVFNGMYWEGLSCLTFENPNRVTRPATFTFGMGWSDGRMTWLSFTARNCNGNGRLKHRGWCSN